MGVIIGKVFAKEKEPDTPEFIAPTPNQIAIIKETWEIPKAHLTDTGEHILFRFLDDFPKNQKKFDAFSNVPLLSLKVSHLSALECGFTFPLPSIGDTGIPYPLRPNAGSYSESNRLLGH